LQCCAFVCGAEDYFYGERVSVRGTWHFDMQWATVGLRSFLHIPVGAFNFGVVEIDIFDIQIAGIKNNLFGFRSC
jgi:hypothetical protein